MSAHYEQNLKFDHLSLKEGLSQSTVYSILQDSKGFMWFGTQDGLNKYDGYQFTVYRHDSQDANSLSHNEVFAIYEDSQGTLWFGTGKGLNRFDSQQNRFIHYLHDPQNPDNSLSNNTVWSINEDNEGLLWIGTDGGGLNKFFGGIHGFNAFYPGRVKDNPYTPPIVVTKLEIFNKPVSMGSDSPLQQHINFTKEMTLSYKQSFFFFEFAALNFLRPEKNQYTYKLEGLDKDWNEIGTRRHAYYTNVPHGTYVFRVKGSNNDGVWNEEGTAIKITILPPPWKTWWAYTLSISQVAWW